MIGEIIDICVKEVSKPSNREKINKDILDPVISVILEKIQPFAIGAIIFLCITVSLMLCILFILIFK